MRSITWRTASSPSNRWSPTLSIRPQRSLCVDPSAEELDRADRIGEFWGNPKTRTLAELLIDCEEDRTLRRAGRDAPRARPKELSQPSSGGEGAQGTPAPPSRHILRV
jgi:hypothetical protein